LWVGVSGGPLATKHAIAGAMVRSVWVIGYNLLRIRYASAPGISGGASKTVFPWPEASCKARAQLPPAQRHALLPPARWWCGRDDPAESMNGALVAGGHNSPVS